MSVLGFLSVFIGGGIGSALRYLVVSKINTQWGTMVVNIIGAFLIGCVYQYILTKTNIKPEAKLFLSTGLLGGFTTFSTYILDFIVLMNKSEIFEAFSYLLLTIVVGVVFLVAGIKVIQILF